MLLGGGEATFCSPLSSPRTTGQGRRYPPPQRQDNNAVDNAASLSFHNKSHNDDDNNYSLASEYGRGEDTTSPAALAAMVPASSATPPGSSRTHRSPVSDHENTRRAEQKQRQQLRQRHRHQINTNGGNNGNKHNIPGDDDSSQLSSSSGATVSSAAKQLPATTASRKSLFLGDHVNSIHSSRSSSRSSGSGYPFDSRVLSSSSTANRPTWDQRCATPQMMSAEAASDDADGVSKSGQDARGSWASEAEGERTIRSSSVSAEINRRGGVPESATTGKNRARQKERVDVDDVRDVVYPGVKQAASVDGDGGAGSPSSPRREYNHPDVLPGSSVLPVGSFALPVGSSSLPGGSWDASPVMSRRSRTSTSSDTHSDVSKGKHSLDGREPQFMDSREEEWTRQPPPPFPAPELSRRSDVLGVGRNEELEAIGVRSAYGAWNSERGVGKQGESLEIGSAVAIDTRYLASTVKLAGVSPAPPAGLTNLSAAAAAATPAVPVTRFPWEKEKEETAVSRDPVGSLGAPSRYRPDAPIPTSTEASAVAAAAAPFANRVTREHNQHKYWLGPTNTSISATAGVVISGDRSLSSESAAYRTSADALIARVDDVSAPAPTAAVKRARSSTDVLREAGFGKGLRNKQSSGRGLAEEGEEFVRGAGSEQHLFGEAFRSRVADADKLISKREEQV